MSPTLTRHDEPPVFRSGHYLLDYVLQLIHTLPSVVVVHVFVLKNGNGNGNREVICRIRQSASRTERRIKYSIKYNVIIRGAEPGNQGHRTRVRI
jgi:hypothetical protein